MQPKVSIIVLNWNGKEDTKECILSVKDIDYENYDIIVVDNASTDDSVEYLRRNFTDLKLITNNENLGYVGGNNAGIRYALKKGSDFILLLNNDVVVSRNFLKRLVDTAKSRSDIGVIGPLIYYYKMKKINFAGGYIDSKTFMPTIRGYKQDDSRKFNKTEEVDYVSGACILIKSHLFKNIGLFDEDYFILWEETDFCFRVKKAGYKVFFQPESFIWHKESVTFKNNDTPRYLYYSIRNKLLFLKKNIPGTGTLRFKIALEGMMTISRLLKKHRDNDNIKKAQAYFFAVRDFYLKRYRKGPQRLYE